MLFIVLTQWRDIQGSYYKIDRDHKFYISLTHESVENLKQKSENYYILINIVASK